MMDAATTSGPALGSTAEVSTEQRRPRILLGLSGSVACIKVWRGDQHGPLGIPPSLPTAIPSPSTYFARTFDSVSCAVQAALLVAGLLEFADVKIVATKSAQHFIQGLSFPEAALPVRLAIKDVCPASQAACSKIGPRAVSVSMTSGCHVPHSPSFWGV